MAKSIRDIPKKKRGRPSTGGRREGILVRLETDQFDALDAWIAKQKRAGASSPRSHPPAGRTGTEGQGHKIIDA